MLWDVARRSRIATLTGELAMPSSLAFSPDDSTLAIGNAFGIELRPLEPAAAREPLRDDGPRAHAVRVAHPSRRLRGEASAR